MFKSIFHICNRGGECHRNNECVRNDICTFYIFMPSQKKGIDNRLVFHMQIRIFFMYDVQISMYISICMFIYILKI